MLNTVTQTEERKISHKINVLLKSGQNVRVFFRPNFVHVFGLNASVYSCGCKTTVFGHIQQYFSLFKWVDSRKNH